MILSKLLSHMLIFLVYSYSAGAIWLFNSLFEQLLELRQKTLAAVVQLFNLALDDFDPLGTSWTLSKRIFGQTLETNLGHHSRNESWASLSKRIARSQQVAFSTSTDPKATGCFCPSPAQRFDFRCRKNVYSLTFNRQISNQTVRRNTRSFSIMFVHKPSTTLFDCGPRTTFKNYDGNLGLAST